MNKEVRKYLIEGDRPLTVLPELATSIGLEKAIILQQLHWLLRDKRNGKVLRGRRGKWIYNTYKQWKEFFPWMSERVLMRHFTQLEKGWGRFEPMIESCQPDYPMSTRKYYQVIGITYV